MKKLMFALLVASSLFSTAAIAYSCGCTKGSMTVTVSGSTVSMSCSDGGQVQCTFELTGP
jgi:hypothetical protein